MRPELLVRRFVRLAKGGWLDVATAEPALVCGLNETPPPAHAREALCRTIRRWSQPVIAPLLDWGELADGRWFDAWAATPSARQASPMVVEGAASWLRAHGWRLGPDCICGEHDRQPVIVPWPTVTALEPGDPGPAAHAVAVPIAIELIDHPLAAELLARLEECREPGPHVWPIDAPPGSGLRQFWRSLATELRARGFSPVHAACFDWFLAGTPASGRCRGPLVVLNDAREWTAAGRRALAGLVLRIGLGAMPDVVLDVVRRGRPQPAPLVLGGVDPQRLADAVRLHPAVPLARDDIVCAAAQAHGLPGVFMRRLAWLASRQRIDEPPAVHETSAPYGAPPVNDALERAAALGRSGRRAAGLRWLRRSAGAFVRRGDHRGATAMALAQTRLAGAGRDPIAVARAWQHAAAILDGAQPEAQTLMLASGLAEWMLLDGRLARAEALLRAASSSAAMLSARDCARTARLLLSECLCWRARWAEAADVVKEDPGQRAGALRVWSALGLGDLDAALADAARLMEAPAGTPGDRVAALVARARCDAWCGDPVRADAALDEAASLASACGTLRARELAVFRLEAAVRAGARDVPAGVLARARQVSARGWPRLLRCRARLALVLASRPDAAGRTRLEQQVRQFVLDTGAVALQPGAVRSWPWPPPADRRTAMLQDVLEVLQACQRDEAPGAALSAVSRLVRDRTRAAGVAVLGLAPDDELRTLGGAGRVPAAEVGRRAVDLRLPVPPSRDGDLTEAACPIAFAGHAVGALTCRWHGAPGAASAPLMTLLETVATAIAPTVRLALELIAPSPGAPAAPATELLLGDSDAMQAVRRAVVAAARAPFPVLVEGESGSGKELVARAIHRASPRRPRAFCALNCAALGDDLLEAELFGHARGAFTGAVTERAGLFEEADGGTLLLDEVSELSPRAQAKLLRVLQEGEIRRLGETRARRVDVRIVAASNRPIRELVDAGRFRHDLRYRLDVVRIEVPPLRVRPEDIPQLVRHYWQRAVAPVGSRAVLAPDTCAALVSYGWPGNVRELQNVLAALAVTAPRAGRLGPEALPAPVGDRRPAAVLPLEEARRRFESGYVRDVLARSGGNRTRAAVALGVTRQGLAKLIDRLGVGEGGGGGCIVVAGGGGGGGGGGGRGEARRHVDGRHLRGAPGAYPA